MTENAARAPATMAAIAPIWFATDLRRTVDYYTEILGFEEEFVYGDPPFYGSVRRHDIRIHLRHMDSPVQHTREGARDVETVDAYVLVSDVDSLFAEYKSKGAKIVFGPRTMEYGLREFYVEELNGYRIAFGQPTPAP